jgi:tetratricopeptide (TPR) repeat protein
VTPYELASQSGDAIDFLQYPRETLQYHAGDCSDLSILYASCFQALGIETAFITVPGHIFIAIDTRLSPEQAAKELLPASWLIVKDGHAWIPIEITLRHDGFMKAWELAAKEWNEGSANGKAGFWPVAQAWKAYEPVGLPGAETTVAVPQSDKILVSYSAEVDRWLDQMTAPLVSKYQAQIATGSLTALNQLGVLYAKYGKADLAQAQFEAAVAKKSDYLPAIINIGHLNYVNSVWDKALTWYRKAAVLDSGNPQTVLAMARANLELKNIDAAKAQYEQLKVLDPKLAQQFAYLGDGAASGTRASDVDSQRRQIDWDTDQ